MKKWNYKYEADITLGEYQNKGFKWFSIVLISIIVLSISVLYFYRDTIYDIVVNPNISLIKTEVEIEVNTDFNPNDYLINPYQLEVALPNEIDTSKLGNQTLVYKSSKNEVTLNLKIIDKTPPTLILTEEVMVLTRGEETSFKVEDKVKEVKDNITKEVKVIYPTNIDFSQKNIDLVYKAVDESNNETTKTLKLIINDKVEPQVIREEVRVEVPSSSNQPSQPSYQPSTPSSSRSSGNPYISGTRNHTVKKGTRVSTLGSLLAQGVSGSGYVSIDYSSVNLTKVGSYTVTYSGSDGAISTITVTVVE